MKADRDRHLRGAEAEFAARSRATREILARHAPIDVLVTLGVSELWMPNIAAQVRHHFILGLAVSMEAAAYSGVRSLDNYVDAAQFLHELYALVPTFPALEDFVPEPDWGEVRVPLVDAYARVFYGGSVERIADFVEAFRLVHWSNAAACASLDYAIAIQDAVLSHVERGWDGDSASLEAGHLEVPQESFWASCRPALLAACSAATVEDDRAASGLVPRVGELARRATATDFVNSFMTGRSVRALAVDIDGTRIPVGLRNAIGMLVDYWTDRTTDALRNGQAELDERIAAFVASRLGSTATVTGPCRLVSRNNLVPRRFATLINAQSALLLILVVDAGDLESLGSLPAQMRAVLDDPEGWGLRLPAEKLTAQLRRSDGSWPRHDDVKLVIVLSNLTTNLTSLPMPIREARAFSLWDFVTIFDSLENAGEILKFWAYADALEEKLGPMLGPVDLFASYRDSDAVLIDGAITPNMVVLDPHWNSDWRYRVLSDFWRAAPPQFPDRSHAWNVEPMSDGLQRLTSKGSLTLAWSAPVGGRVVQAVLHVPDPPLDLQNGRLLELFIHCVIDGFAQRAALVESTGVLPADHLVIGCDANESTLTTEHDDAESPARVDAPLLSDWTVSDASAGHQLLSVRVNLARVQARLHAPSDASFEAEAVVEVLRGIAQLDDRDLSQAHVDALAETGRRRPRFVLTKVRRRIDVPDHPDPDLPLPEHFKLARRELAMAIRDRGIEPGDYHLAQAKAIIDPARDALREKVHARITALDRDSLLAWAISFHDELTARYQHQVYRVRQSLTHEVSFDRSSLLAEEYTKYVNTSRNVRYLLEAALTLPAHRKPVATASELLSIVATIDWLLVLYGASDVLHNDIEVAGITISDQYVPVVFYGKRPVITG